MTILTSLTILGWVLFVLAVMSLVIVIIRAARNQILSKADVVLIVVALGLTITYLVLTGAL